MQVCASVYCLLYCCEMSWLIGDWLSECSGGAELRSGFSVQRCHYYLNVMHATLCVCVRVFSCVVELCVHQGMLVSCSVL